MSADGDFVNVPSVLGTASGALFVWYNFDGMYRQRSSPLGAPPGGKTLIDPEGGESVLLATADGGYLLVYRRYVFGDLTGMVVMRAHGPSDELRHTGSGRSPSVAARRCIPGRPTSTA